MSEEQTLTTNPPTEMNSEAVRTETGEIKDQSNGQPRTESNTDNSGDSATKSDASTESAPPVVPEKYEFTIPEGKTLDPKLLEEATPIFKELKLDQASAQRLVDLYSKSTSGIQDQLLSSVEKLRTDWRDAVARDPVVGTKIREAQVEIGRVKDLLPPEVRTAFNEAMDFTGAGDHPAVFRAMYELAKIVNEGSHVSGGAPSPHGQQPNGKVNPPTAAKAMYPKLA